jgi:plastocyanin
MKKHLQLLGLAIFSGCMSLSAQTTHQIDWTTGVGTAATLTIEVGDEIVWTNTQAVSHDVISNDVNAPAGFGSTTMANGETYSFTFNNPVQFGYLCSFHPGSMVGQITVVENISCSAPTDVAVTGVTDVTASFSWVPSPEEVNGYAWVVMGSGDDPDTDTPVDSGVTGMGITTASAAGLSAETDYDFYVETQCGNDGNSGYAGPASFTTDVLGLSKNELEGFKFYPNPASDIVKLDAQDNIESVTVYNMMSQEVLNEVASSKTNSMELNISKLENGSYFLEVKSGNQVGVYKFIKK